MHQATMTAQTFPTMQGRPPGSARALALLAASMVCAIILIAIATIWDAELQHADAMEDFAHSQTALATSASQTLAAEVRLAAAQGKRVSAHDMLAALRNLERPGEVAVFVKPPGEHVLYASDGRRLDAAVVAASVAGGQSVRLSRDDAQTLGLAPRMALAAAGLAEGTADGWVAVVASSASRPRDRRLQSRVRALIGVILPSALIIAFGGVAFRRQRRELDLTRKLQLADTQRQGDERLARANRVATTGTMAIGIAHEISTPLGVILGRAEQLREQLRDDERGGRAAQAIIEQAGRIHRVIRGILDLAHGGIPEMKLVAPSEVIRRAAELVQHRFNNAAVRLEIQLAEDLPLVRVNGPLFEHALVNLLLNSCDASKAGDTVYTIATAPEHKRCVEFVILDGGAGISAQDAARLMEPFFTTKPMGSGTGLGLAIANEVVKSHRGTLSLAPAQGGGTRAVIEIPITNFAESEPT
jgi:two-component system, NtrC family, sensor kinase